MLIFEFVDDPKTWNIILTFHYAPVCKLPMRLINNKRNRTTRNAPHSEPLGFIIWNWNVFFTFQTPFHEIRDFRHAPEISGKSINASIQSTQWPGSSPRVRSFPGWNPASQHLILHLVERHDYLNYHNGSRRANCLAGLWRYQYTLKYDKDAFNKKKPKLCYPRPRLYAGS